MLVYGGGFNPPHQGHVGALRSAYDALAKAGYKVDGSIVAPTADKLLAKKQMDDAHRLGLQDRAAVAKAAFPTDINGSPVSIRTEPADEIERGTTKPRRSDLARWAQSQYPNHTIVNVSGEDAAVPGAPGMFPALYSGEIGSNHEGVNYITLPRDLDGGISSSKIRAALSSGGPLEGMTPESEMAYRDALARHLAAQAPMAVTAARTLWASFCREWGVGSRRVASIYDHMHELDDDGMPRWLDDPYERSHAQALRDLGEDRSFAQYLADRAYNKFMDIKDGPDENLAETWWGRSGQADDYLRSLGGEV